MARGRPRHPTRNLHVAISSLRHTLEPGVARGASSMIVRDGDAYRLTLPAGSRVDLSSSTRLWPRRGPKRRRRRRRWPRTTVRSTSTRGAAPRGRPRRLGGQRARPAARRGLRGRPRGRRVHIERGDPVAAAVACERGLHADQYNDALWRLCMSAYEQAGDAAAAARASRSTTASSPGSASACPTTCRCSRLQALRRSTRPAAGWASVQRSAKRGVCTG